MWRFDLSSATGLVRIGRHAVERWDGVPGRLEPISTQAVERANPWDVTSLSSALERVLSGGSSRARLRVVIESAWMPVVAVEPGPAWSPNEVQALLRHRFESVYRDTAAGIGKWRILSDYRVGDGLALGYAMHPAIDALFDRQAHLPGHRWADIVPALAWGLSRLRKPRGVCWLVWPEQDRQLLALVRAGTVIAFNACAELEATPARIARQVAVERVRAGLAADESTIEVGSWTPIEHHDEPALRLRWLGLASPQRAPNAAAHIAGGAST